MTYKPLPKNLTIKQSGIEGLGLFSLEKQPAFCEFGISHIKDDRFENGYIRTPLGGFYNHSDNPNCESYAVEDFIKIRSIREILEGEELTVKYWLYEL